MAAGCPGGREGCLEQAGRRRHHGGAALLESFDNQGRNRRAAGTKNRKIRQKIVQMCSLPRRPCGVLEHVDHAPEVLPARTAAHSESLESAKRPSTSVEFFKGRPNAPRLVGYTAGRSWCRCATAVRLHGRRAQTPRGKLPGVSRVEEREWPLSFLWNRDTRRDTEASSCSKELDSLVDGRATKGRMDEALKNRQVLRGVSVAVVIARADRGRETTSRRGTWPSAPEMSPRLHMRLLSATARASGALARHSLAFSYHAANFTVLTSTTGSRRVLRSKGSSAAPKVEQTRIRVEASKTPRSRELKFQGYVRWSRCSRSGQSIVVASPSSRHPLNRAKSTS
ncbi:hypothetical protein KM043_016238 [Ampulex compressa]|nr:hypothetical protein KM043_016238 [Ampulex compressa]